MKEKVVKCQRAGSQEKATGGRGGYSYYNLLGSYGAVFMLKAIVFIHCY